MEVLDVLRNITSYKINVFDSTNHHELQVLQEYLTLLVSFLSRCPKEADGNIPQVLSELIADVKACMVKPFEVLESSPCHYHSVPGAYRGGFPGISGNPFGFYTLPETLRN